MKSNNRPWILPTRKPLCDSLLKRISISWDAETWESYLKWYQRPCKEALIGASTYDQICNSRSESIYQEYGYEVDEALHKYCEILLSTLPKIEEKVLRLYFFEGQTELQIALKLRISKSGAHVAKKRGLLRLASPRTEEKVGAIHIMRGTRSQNEIENPSIWDTSEGAICEKRGHTVHDGRGLLVASPGIQTDLPIIDSKILVERDFVNRISRAPVEVSPMGGIRVFNLRSLTDLPVGSEAGAVLTSGASNGIVKAKLVTPMLVDGEPALPEGAILFGHGKSTEERLFVEFTKAILPSGETFSIIAQAFDGSDKILGLRGSTVGSKTKKLAMGMALGFMGGMADGLQNTSGSSIFMAQQRPSVRDAALSGTAKATLDQSQLYLDQVKNSPDIIEVKQGTEFYVIVDDPGPPKNQK